MKKGKKTGQENSKDNSGLLDKGLKISNEFDKTIEFGIQSIIRGFDALMKLRKITLKDIESAGIDSFEISAGISLNNHNLPTEKSIPACLKQAKLFAEEAISRRENFAYIEAFDALIAANHALMSAIFLGSSVTFEETNENLAKLGLKKLGQMRAAKKNEKYTPIKEQFLNKYDERPPGLSKKKFIDQYCNDAPFNKVSSDTLKDWLKGI